MTVSSKPRPAKRRKAVIKTAPVSNKRSLRELELFEIGLLPFLYLEYVSKLLLDRFSTKAFN
tara:strand:+ start:454 stop:639 length:186 start_codon:yes stop_codon:yes gene_type:complete